MCFLAFNPVVVIYPNKARPVSGSHPNPHWPKIHLELVKHRSLTLTQIWKGYIKKYPIAVQYCRVTDLYRAWRKCELDQVMCQSYKAGEWMLLDYSCKKPRYVESATSEMQTPELVVVVLGASN